MPYTLDQILPSLQALGYWSYWIIGISAMFEAFFVTGVFIPGTLIVDAGGVLVQQGAIDFFDLVWFVAIGSILGGEISYLVGRLAKRGLNSRWDPKKSPSYQKAERLFGRYGGAAMVFGRFLGPVSGLVPFAAAISGMGRRRFTVWNIISGFPYALGNVAFGYFLGGVIASIGPMATRLTLLAVIVLVVLVILWWLILRIERLLPFVVSILRSIARGIAENPDVQALAERHPNIADMVAHRLDASRFTGLLSTLLGIAAVYISTLWIGSVLEVFKTGAVVQTDIRLANLFHAFWSPGLIELFTRVTALGDWRVITAFAIVILVWLWLRRRPDLALGLAISVIGNVVSVTILKKIFDRPRPALAYFVETSGSFPSGHAAISVAFYGMLFFILWKLGRIGPIFATLAAVTLAFFIGFSRIYLIEHYLSDVLNGWLVGSMLLVIGIAAAERWRATRPLADMRALKPSRRTAATTLQVGLALLAFAQVALYDKARNITQPKPVARQIVDIRTLFASGRLPDGTESVASNPLEPINIIIHAKDRAALIDALRQAGWTQAELPTVASLSRATWAVLMNVRNSQTPVTPYFWRRRPNDLAFQKHTTEKSPRKRHHVRFWQTRYVAADHLGVFVGAASFDDGLDWQLLHHIDPNIDAERDKLVADLAAAGKVGKKQMFRLSKPRLGQSVAGDPWFTDGRAVIISLR